MGERSISQAERNQQLVSQYGLFLRNTYGTGNSNLFDILAMARAIKEFSDKRSDLIDSTDSPGTYINDEAVRKTFMKGPAPYMVGRNVETQQRIVSWLLDSGLEDTETLSVGAGPAPAEIFLSSVGLVKKKITALDFSAPLLALGKTVAKEKGVENIDFVEKAASDMDYEDQFGQTIMLDSLHWMDNWRGCLKKVARATKSGGNIFIVYVSTNSPRLVIPEFELVKTLLDMGTDVMDIKYIAGKDLPRVMVAAKKQQPVQNKLFVPIEAHTR